MAQKKSYTHAGHLYFVLSLILKVRSKISVEPEATSKRWLRQSPRNVAWISIVIFIYQEQACSMCEAYVDPGNCRSKSSRDDLANRRSSWKTSSPLSLKKSDICSWSKSFCGYTGHLIACGSLWVPTHRWFLFFLCFTDAVNWMKVIWEPCCYWSQAGTHLLKK